MARASCEAHAAHFIPQIVRRGGTSVNFKGIPLGFFSEDFVGASEPFSKSSRSATLLVGNLLEERNGCLYTTPLQVNSTEVVLGDDTVVVEVHGPGYKPSELFTIHP